MPQIPSRRRCLDSRPYTYYSQAMALYFSMSYTASPRPKNRPEPLHKVTDCNVRKLPGVSVPYIFYTRPETGYTEGRTDFMQFVS